MAEALAHNNFISEAKDGKTSGLIFLNSKSSNSHESSAKEGNSPSFKAASFDTLSLKERTEVQCTNFNGKAPKGNSLPPEKSKPLLPKNKKKAKKAVYTLHGNGYRLSHGENFSLFFLRGQQQQAKFIELSISLNEYSRQTTNLIKVADPKINQIYLSHVDGDWARVQLYDPPKEGYPECLVQLTDIGSKVRVKYDSLHVLGKEYRDVPPLVFKCALRSVDIQYLQRDSKAKMNDWVAQKLSNKLLSVESYYKRPHDSYSTLLGKKNYIDVFDEKGRHINALARKEVEKLTQLEFISMPSKEVRTPLDRGYASAGIYSNKDEWSQYSSEYNNTDLPFRSQYCRINPPPGRDSMSYPQRVPLLQTPWQASQRDASRSFPSQQADFYASTEEKERYIGQLRGQLRAYTSRMNSLENDSLTLAMLQDCLKMFFPLLKERSQLNKFLVDNSPLLEGINYLFQDKTFHSRFDDVIQLLDTMVASSKKCWNYAATVDRLEDILRNADIPSLKGTLELLIRSLKQHLSREAVAVLESQSANDKVFGLFVTPYTGISQGFLKWKKDYLESQKGTDGAIRNVIEFFSDLGGYMQGILDPSPSSTKEMFAFTDLDLRSLQAACETEQSIAKQECSEKAMVSVLEELDLRLKKIRRAELSLREFGLASFLRTSSADSSPPVSEDDYPSLVKFISQSRSLKGSIKRLVVQDIVADICQIHSEGRVYKHLNPQNILMNEGAKLRITSEICIYEPVPPWKFQAPECSAESNGTLGGIGYPHVGQAADCFSLGQLMVWLACLNGDDDYGDKIKHYKATIPLLRSLLDPKPSFRPSISQVREKLDDILPILYGSDDANEELLNGVPETPSESSERVDEDATETFSNCVRQESILQSVLEEEEQILKEMMDSDPED